MCIVPAAAAVGQTLFMDPAAIPFSEVEILNPTFNYHALTIINNGPEPVTFTQLTCTASSMGMDVTKFSFVTAPGGMRAFCGAGAVPLSPAVNVPSNGRASITVWFEPKARGAASAIVVFTDGGNVAVQVCGIVVGGRPFIIVCGLLNMYIVVCIHRVNIQHICMTCKVCIQCIFSRLQKTTNKADASQHRSCLAAYRMEYITEAQYVTNKSLTLDKLCVSQHRELKRTAPRRG